MAIEDLDWQERYGDQSHKAHSLRSIWVTFLALHISQAVVLPTLFQLLLSMHSRILMLGYCLAATCLGELCAGPMFSMWYDKRPAKEAVVAALILNAGGSFLYAISPNRVSVLASRFLVGCGCGVQGVLWTIVGGFTSKDNRAEVISSMKMLRHLGFIMGVGIAAVATWQHDSPAPFGRLDRAIPEMSVRGPAAVPTPGVPISNSSSPQSPPSSMPSSGGYLWGAFDWMTGEVSGMSDQRPLGDVKEPMFKRRRGPAAEERGNFSQSMLHQQRGVEDLQEDFDGLDDFDELSSLHSRALQVLTMNASLGGNATSENQTVFVDWSGPDAVVTDDEIQRKEIVAGNSFYIPSYITGLVGKNWLRAPGYLGGTLSLMAVVFVSLTLKEPPRKYLSHHVPLAQLNPRALSCFAPLAACVGLETAAQFAIVSLEMMVPALIAMWEVWTPDAVAIYMMGLSCLGVVGYASQEPLQAFFPLRYILLGASILLVIGTTQAIAWEGRMILWRYTLGLALVCFAAAPLSTICTQIVNRAVIKTYSEEGAMVWAQLFWSITSVPAHTVGPLGLAYCLELDESGALGYMCLLLVTCVAVAILVFFQSELITPQVGDDAEVLPGSEPSINGDGVSMHRYAPLSP